MYDNIVIGNTAMSVAGCWCGNNVVGPHHNIIIGKSAGEYHKCGCCLIAIGPYAGMRMCCGQGMPILLGPKAGCCAGSSACGQQDMIVIGSGAACRAGSCYGIAIGAFAQRFNRSYGGISLGWCAAVQNGSSTTSITQCNNISIGACSMGQSRYICNSIAIGMWAGYMVGCCNGSGNSYDSIHLGNYSGASDTANSAFACQSVGNVFIGTNTKVPCGSQTFCNAIVIGNWVTGVNNCSAIGNSSTTTTYVCGTVTKGSGTFKIIHPNPKKTNKWLNHSFTESPTAGDNLYRYKFNVSNCKYCLKLPEYYKYLNTCNMAWVYPVEHFGEGYAEIDKNKENLIIKTNKDGCYNVLLMGTRCDDWALKHWHGTERHKDSSKWSCNLNG
tara:strand:+ start:648 stop:1802 length:1155 start_codon:yes stop_codon:yes gene_type:complete